MKLIKRITLLFIIGFMFACGGESDSNQTTDETEEEATEETPVVEENSTMSIIDLMLMAYDDEGLNEEYTIKGWFSGMLGSLDSEHKTLYLHDEQGSNNAALEIELDAAAEEALKDATFDNEITVTVTLNEYTGFGTHIKANNCTVVAID